jgi:hypothetical protein
MNTKTYVLAVGLAATTNAAAQVQFPRAGHIVAVQMVTTRLPSGGASESTAWQVSTQSTFNQANDAQGIVFGLIQAFTTATAVGLMEISKEANISGLAIPIQSGDRLYLHAILNGASTSTAVAIIHVAE